MDATFVDGRYKPHSFKAKFIYGKSDTATTKDFQDSSLIKRKRRAKAKAARKARRITR